MKRKLILLTLLLSLGFFICGCGTNKNVSDDMSNNIESNYLGNILDNGYRVHTVIDKETGVNYIILTRWRTGGEITMCPRYNADGSLYVSK